MLNKIFKLSQNNTTPRTELLGGVTTFMTMAYILVVNPSILSVTGMDSGALFTATALSAALACVLMGVIANLPVALAPGMGVNAFFAYAIVLQMGYTWEMALAAVFIEGVIFILLSLFNIREMIVRSIPPILKTAIGIGIGLYLAVIGLVNAGVIIKGEPLMMMGNFTTPSVFLTLVAVIIIGTMLIKKVPGALLIGMVVTTIIAIPLGVVTIPADFKFFSVPHSIEPLLFKMDFSQVWSFDMIIIIFTLIFSDLFDTAGTLIAVCGKSNLIDKNGEIKNVKRAFLSDAIATTVGATMGASTVTSYIESATGVAAGGRTGLTSVVTGGMFLLALFFAPLFAIIPIAATSAALIIVGLFMVSSLSNIDFEDYKTALPAFITILFIPLSYNIATGIIYGFLSYVIIHILSGKHKDVST
ncbi:MAG: NCS2 family permease, partial [Rikenellaceae bacterium]